MNIQSVNSFDAAISQLSAIKGNVTADQLTDLTNLFSTQIWNTSDAEGTTATIERQIQQLEALLDEIQAEIDEVYNQQKYANEEMNSLVNDLNEESYQASKQADKNIKEQQDLVTAATDEAYNMYMKGEIEKEEIPMYIANSLKNGNAPGGAAMEAHLEAMDSKGQKITSLSNKIATMLDSINENKAKYQTTEASLDMLKQLKAQVPEKKERADIQQSMERPYYSPSQEALGDKIIDAFKEPAGSDDKFSNSNPAVKSLKESLTGSGTVDAARKAELDAMTPEEKSAAVEEADFSKYSALELMYLSGMDVTQAGFAIGQIYSGAQVGYNEQNGNIMVPFGHGLNAEKAYRELENQYATLWGGTFERGSEDENGNKGSADPIGWREGDRNFMFAIDRDGDNIFDGAEEFVGAQNGWAELAAFDTNGDNTLTADELAAGGVRVVDVDQSLTGGGNYGFNGIKESGFESLDLASYTAIADAKGTNLNGNTRVAEFTLTVNGEETLGKQTENTEEYNDLFYGHMYGEAYSFGLDPNEVADALNYAARPEDYMAVERMTTELTVENAEDIIETDANNIANKEEELAQVTASAANNTGAELSRVEDEDENENEDENIEETATTETTNTTETVASTTETTVDNKIKPDEIV